GRDPLELAEEQPLVKLGGPDMHVGQRYQDQLAPRRRLGRQAGLHVQRHGFTSWSLEAVGYPQKRRDGDGRQTLRLYPGLKREASEESEDRVLLALDQCLLPLHCGGEQLHLPAQGVQLCEEPRVRRLGLLVESLVGGGDLDGLQVEVRKLLIITRKLLGRNWSGKSDAEHHEQNHRQPAQAVL